MPVEQLIRGLRLNKDFMRQVVAWERMRPRRAEYAPVPTVAPIIKRALTNNGVTQLFTHQTNAINESLSGKNVIISTGTASGKTLCYLLPVLHRLVENPRARALLLFPTKALAQDQLAALNALISAGEMAIEANVYDGDTPRSKRNNIRRHSQIILSNPDMLHAGILPYHTGWRDIFANLAYVVIDEVHTYRGIFGSHVANVLRRLRRICNFYGSNPQFICCSATIANPQEHAEKLCNIPFVVIDETQNGSPRGLKHFILYNPPVIDGQLGMRQSMILTAMEAASVFLQHEVQTVIFARSRQAVELLLGYLRDTVKNERSADDNQTPKSKVAGYRGGYLPLERREIERGLRAGDIRGVVATNALELGVDIGALDAAVLCGYPGSVASVWQQVGRAGRRDGVSLALMIAGNTPLEQYICKHPRWLLGSSAENALTNPDNLQITTNHLLCAAYELPFERHEKWGEWDDAEELLEFLAAEGQLHQTRNRFHWIGQDTPSPKISLRTGGADNVVIQTRDNARPQVLGEVDLHRAAVTVYEDAIYTHRGQTYLVDEFDHEGRIAHVRPIDVDYYTTASVNSDIQQLSAVHQEQRDGMFHAHGDVLVVTKATTFRKVRRYTHESVGMGIIELPEWELDTTGYWLVFGEALAEQLYERGILFRPNDYGPNWSTQRQKALKRDKYKCRNCGASGQSGAILHVHHIRPFREYGYKRGENNNYLHANRVENLATLCPKCHRQAEMSVQQRSAMGGLAYVLRNLAPLFLMCDSGDIQVVANSRNPLTQAPTIVIYERAAAGVGFSEKLFEIHDMLLLAAAELVRDCRCMDGCPACVGPPSEIGTDTKTVTLQMLQILIGVTNGTV